VTEQLKEGKHGKTSVLKLLKLALLLLVTEIGLSEIKVTEDTPVVDGSDEEDDLGPAKSGDVVDGGDSVGDVVGGDSGGDVVSEAVGLGGDVSEDGEHADASVLELGGAVFVELLLGDVLGKVQGIEESSGGNNSKLVLESLNGCGGTSLLDRGESGGGTGGGSEDGKLHHFGNRLSGVRFGL